MDSEGAAKGVDVNLSRPTPDVTPQTPPRLNGGQTTLQGGRTWRTRNASKPTTRSHHVVNMYVRIFSFEASPDDHQQY
jgi:hypothetical protein